MLGLLPNDGDVVDDEIGSTFGAKWSWLIAFPDLHANRKSEGKQMFRISVCSDSVLSVFLSESLCQ